MKHILVPYVDEKPTIINEQDNITFIKNTTDTAGVEKQLSAMGILFDEVLLPMGRLHTFDKDFLNTVSKFVEKSELSLNELTLAEDVI